MEIQAFGVILVTFLTTRPIHGDSSVIQASLDMGGETHELLQMVFKKLELLGNIQNETAQSSQSHTELATALLRQAPVITLKGNITDPSRRFTITFTLQASQNSLLLDGSQEDEDDDDDEGWAWRHQGGVFQPLVEVVEPYVHTLAELVFHGVLSSVIGKFLESTTLVGDGRIV